MAWPLLLVLLAAVVVAFLTESWQYALVGAAIQYLTMSLLLLREGPPLLSLLRLGVGVAAVLILFLTLRQLGLASRRGSAMQRVLRASRDHPYRLAALSLTAVIAYGLATTNPFLELTTEGSIAAFFLAGSAALMLVVGRQALRDGISLLFLDSAVQFLAAGSSLGIEFLPYALMNLMTPLLALAIAFTVTLQQEVGLRRGRSE